MDQIFDEERCKLMMEFYEDVEVDFGDKSYNFAELLQIAKGNISDSENRKKNRTEMVVWEDEVDAGEVYIDDRRGDAEYYNRLNTDISLDVLELNGDTLLNESLEERYKQQNPSKDALAIKNKSKSSSKRPPRVSSATSKMLKKAVLRKEMLASQVSSDNVMTFVAKKTNNALLNALCGKPSIINDDAKAAENETPEPQTTKIDTVKRERTLKWIMEQCSSEEEFYSAKSSPSNDLSASTSDNDTPRKYRATSQRFKKKITPTVADINEPGTLKISATSNSISSKSLTTSDEAVGFKSPPVVLKALTSKAAKKKDESTEKHEVYTPGSYHREFQLENSNFPAIR